MATREAVCHCGQLRLEVDGDPFWVSLCHCIACQRRTGSAFGMQAGFRADQVQAGGRYSDYARISDEADRKEHVFHFCPECGSRSSIPSRRSPTGSSSWSARSPTRPFHHRWSRATTLAAIRGCSSPTRSSARRPRSGTRCALSTRRASTPRQRARACELLEAHPGQAYLLYNVACCESLAGETGRAVEHLRHAVDLWEGCREMASEDSDFEPIRADPAFQELLAR